MADASHPPQVANGRRARTAVALAVGGGGNTTLLYGVALGLIGTTTSTASRADALLARAAMTRAASSGGNASCADIDSAARAAVISPISYSCWLTGFDTSFSFMVISPGSRVSHPTTNPSCRCTAAWHARVVVRDGCATSPCLTGYSFPWQFRRACARAAATA